VDGIEMFTAAELALEAGVTQSRVRQLCARGRLNARKIARDWLIPRADGEAYLSSEARRRLGARVYRDRLKALDAGQLQLPEVK